MKKTVVIISVVLLAIILLTVFAIVKKTHKGHVREGEPLQSVEKDVYYCPMHPDYTSDKPGNCPICGMTLVKKEKIPAESEKQEGAVYYQNPMDPSVTSPVPMKDAMGMDYVPVRKGGEDVEKQKQGVYISPERQQSVGIKKEVVAVRQLVNNILTVGRIAYDPELYVAQEEYVQALKTAEATKNSVLGAIKDQSGALVLASEKRLMLMGMSRKEIEKLARSKKAQENLFLPIDQEKVWIYVTVYEVDIGLIKEGMPVEIEAIAYPGETFSGKIISMTPVLDPVTRTAQVRAEVVNREDKLKPEMFVNVRIRIEIGRKLAIPESALMETGERKLVFVANPDGYFEQREVKTGRKTEGFYEVVSGVKEGEEVVSSGNFFVDSESKLKGSGN